MIVIKSILTYRLLGLAISIMIPPDCIRSTHMIWTAGCWLATTSESFGGIYDFWEEEIRFYFFLLFAGAYKMFRRRLNLLENNVTGRSKLVPVCLWQLFFVACLKESCLQLHLYSLKWFDLIRSCCHLVSLFSPSIKSY